MKILLLEDDAAVAQYVKTCLEDEGEEVVDVSTPEDALRSADSRGPFDLLITDLNLGTRVDGVDVASELVLRCPDIAVVVLTGAPFQARKRMSAFRAGVILPKPFTSADLFLSVELAFEQSSPSSGGPPQ